MPRFDPQTTLLIVALENQLPREMSAGQTIVFTGVGKVNAAFTEAISELAADEFDPMIRRLYSRI